MFTYKKHDVRVRELFSSIWISHESSDCTTSVHAKVCRFTWWYQQLPRVKVTLVPVKERSLNTLISLDRAFVSGGIGRFSTLWTCWYQWDCLFDKLLHMLKHKTKRTTREIRYVPPDHVLEGSRGTIDWGIRLNKLHKWGIPRQFAISFFLIGSFDGSWIIVITQWV